MLLFLFAAVQVYACKVPIASTTVYYLPDAKDICGAYGKKCAKFLDEVHMQGSGKLYENKIIRYQAKKDKPRKVEYLNGCSTTKGASGQCQIPYISIAADFKYYQMGDIISIPSLKNRKMFRKDGTTFTHPGFLIVHDTGGAIKGKSRFDIFTESSLYDSRNTLGYKAKVDLKFYHNKTCTDIKTIANWSDKTKGVIKPGTPEYKRALNEIYKSANGIQEESRSSSARTISSQEPSCS